MIEAALRYQTQGEDRLKRVAIGAGVSILSIILFVPIFILNGYMLEVFRRALGGDTTTPPEWDEFDIINVTFDGAKAFIILFLYTTGIGLMLSIPSGTLLLLGVVLQNSSIGFVGGVLAGVTSLVTTILVGVIAPVAIGNFVVTDDIVAGFDVSVLRRVGTNPKMLRTAGVAIGVSFLTGVASSVLSVTLVGAPIAGFIGLSAIAIIWANGFADAYRDTYGELPEIPDGPLKTTTVGESPGTGATATGAGSTTDSGTSAGASDDATGSSGADDTTGPDPRDEERWD